MGTKALSVVFNRFPGASFASRLSRSLPKHWYNIDVVLTDDFPHR